MKHFDNQQSALTGALVYLALGVIAGILLISIPTAFLLNLVFMIMGVVTIVFNLPTLLMALSTADSAIGKTTLVLSAVSVLVGFLMIFWHSSLLMILLGVYMIAMPIIRIVQALDRETQLKAELPKLILGAVLILLGPASLLDILFDVAGAVIIVFSIVYFVLMYFALRKHQNTPGARIFVDSDGNGKVDTVYVDTTGDGKADTATDYKEEQ